MCPLSRFSTEPNTLSSLLSISSMATTCSSTSATTTSEVSTQIPDELQRLVCACVDSWGGYSKGWFVRVWIVGVGTLKVGLHSANKITNLVGQYHEFVWLSIECSPN